MKNFAFLLLLILLTLLQIAWGQWLAVFGLGLPLVWLALLWGLRFVAPATLFVFAFVSGLLFDLLSCGVVGSSALLNVVVLGALRFFTGGKFEFARWFRGDGWKI